MHSHAQSQKMPFELENMQLIFMKILSLAFCLFPAFLLFAALLLDPGHKVVTVFL
jgi:hypothetical protein